MTYYEALKNAVERLESAGVPDSGNDAELMMESAVSQSWAKLLLNRENEMPPEEYERYEALVARRLKREPLQHILGIWEFMGFDFYCTPDCLIPRQDTELLVLTAQKAVEEMLKGTTAVTGDRKLRVLDLCTGSGCVIISLKKLCRDAIEAVGMDISEAALEMARRNAELNNVQVTLRQSDMFENAGDIRYDIITANPPYIETETIYGLNPEITEYEPWIALDGGEDGLKHYRSLAAGAKEYLIPGGRIMMEIGDTQGKAVSDLLKKEGYGSVEVLKDLAGLDRVVRAVLA